MTDRTKKIVEMTQMKTVIGKKGNITVPARYRKMLGLKSGDQVILMLKAGEIRIIPHNQAIKHAQEVVRRYIPDGHKLSAELIRDRREEARGE